MNSLVITLPSSVPHLCSSVARICIPFTTHMRMKTFSLIVAFITVATTTHADENWPQFRGPTGLGYSTDKNLPTEWGGKEEKNILWSAPLVGDGHASPIVWRDQVITCTAFWPADVMDKAKTMPEQHVVSYSTATG